jgi:hypothetical protein
VIVDRFAPEAAALRRAFDARFADPRVARGDRFVWDYWHVPGQYTALRTPAWTYFPRPAYQAFHRRLVAWGRRRLGCHDVSPPWLSCYVEGCEQRLHGDLPHGPWAFVYSLTGWKGRTFRGGETLLARDEVLDFWSDFVSVRSVEEPDLVHAIEPRFDRLVVFDPRVPHGVRRVTGTHDPREGRLVLHGWFVQPRPFVEGPLARAAVRARIADLTRAIEASLPRALPLAGMISLGVSVGASGAVDRVRVLSDTTRVPAADERERARFVRWLARAAGAWRFGRLRARAHVTLPLVFERG